MQIEILKSTIVDMNAVAVGDVVETSQRTADMLIVMGKAKAAPVSQTVVITSEVKETPVPKKTTPKRKPKANGDSQPGI